MIEAVLELETILVAAAEPFARVQLYFAAAVPATVIQKCLFVAEDLCYHSEHTFTLAGIKESIHACSRLMKAQVS